MSAYAHIVTAVIGSGVLSLAWSMSWLGRSLWKHSFAFALSASCLMYIDKDLDPVTLPSYTNVRPEL